MEEKKKRLIWIIGIELIVFLIVVCLFAAGVFRKPAPQSPKEPDSTQATEGTDGTQETEPAETESQELPTTLPTTKPTESVPTEPAETTPQKPPYTPPATEPTEPEPTEPVLTEPSQILTKAKAELKALSSDLKEVSALNGAQTLTIQVSGTDNVQTAAQAILEQVKAALDYEKSLANPNVAVGNPKPFTYEYQLTHTTTQDGKHTFTFAYCFVSASYEVPGQQYSTTRMVEDVCTYLNSLGKTKYDSHEAGYTGSQPVIVLIEHSYETALSIVKAQVESASERYRNYDFYYAALTVTTKGGVEQEALLFYIVNK
jgi:hypothetical protein